MLTVAALVILGISEIFWKGKGWFIAAALLALFSFVWAGFRAWKDCLFNPFIFEIEQLLAFLEKMDFDSVNDSEGVKQSLRFPLARLPDKIESETERRLVGFMSRLISLNERAERLLPSKCLTPLSGLSTGKENILIVRKSLGEYKKVLILHRDRWL